MECKLHVPGLPLPEEVTLKILSHLSPRDLCSARLVCHRWAEVGGAAKLLCYLWAESVQSPLLWRSFSCSFCLSNDDHEVQRAELYLKQWGKYLRHLQVHIDNQLVFPEAVRTIVSAFQAPLSSLTLNLRSSRCWYYYTPRIRDLQKMLQHKYWPRLTEVSLTNCRLRRADGGRLLKVSSLSTLRRLGLSLTYLNDEVLERLTGAGPGDGGVQPRLEILDLTQERRQDWILDHMITCNKVPTSEGWRAAVRRCPNLRVNIDNKGKLELKDFQHALPPGMPLEMFSIVLEFTTEDTATKSLKWLLEYIWIHFRSSIKSCSFQLNVAAGWGPGLQTNLMNFKEEQGLGGTLTCFYLDSYNLSSQWKVRWNM